MRGKVTGLAILQVSALLYILSSIVDAQNTFAVQMPISRLDPRDYNGQVGGSYTTVWQGNYNGGTEGTGGHPGVDIAELGNVVSIADGVVTRLRRTGTQTCRTSSWGVFLVIRHNIPGVGTAYSSYAHLENDSIPLDVQQNQPVQAGQIIGRVGNTGNACPRGTGIHLHFQIDRDIGEPHPYWCGDPNDPNNSTCVASKTISPVQLIRNFTIPPQPIPPTCGLSASPLVVNTGSSSTLSWTTNGNPTSADIDNGIGPVDPVSGSLMISPSADTTYTMTVTNVAGSGTCSTSLTVNQGPPSGTGVWSSGSRMPTPRAALASAEVSGMIYTIGGVLDSSGINIVPTVEAYSPSSDSWFTRTSMPTPRALLAGAEVNGIIYAVGGCTGILCTVPLATVEAYDPGTDQWVTKASMATPRYGLAVVAVNGVLYAIGGANQTSILDSVEAYHPATDTWTASAPMPTPRRLIAGDAINGLVYVIGGRDVADAAFALTQAYDPVSNTWTTKAPMPTARGSLAVGVSDEKLYALGGFAGAGLPSTPALMTVEVYDPVADSWTTVTNLPTARGGLAARASSGVVYAIGGSPSPSGSLALDAVEAFSPVTSVTYDGSVFPPLSAPTWIRFQPPCPSNSGDTTAISVAGGALEIVDFDALCDHWYGRNNELDSTDDAFLEWTVRVPFSTHPAGVVAGFSDGSKLIYVGHTSTQTGILQQDTNGAVSFLGNPIALDATGFHTYRLIKNSNQTVQFFVDGIAQQTVPYVSLPNLPALTFGQFFGAGSNFERSHSFWESVTYTITRRP